MKIAFGKTIVPVGFVRIDTGWAVVVAQLVERLLTTPEFCGSYTVIGKLL